MCQFRNAINADLDENVMEVGGLICAIWLTDKHRHEILITQSDCIYRFRRSVSRTTSCMQTTTVSWTMR